MNNNKGSSYIEPWTGLSPIMYDKFYFFNVTNYKEVEEKNAKPKLQEVGPYTFQKFIKKEIVFQTEDTITYREKTSYVFHKELSSGDQNEKIYLINLPVVAVDKIADLKCPEDMKDIAFTIIDSTLEDYKETVFLYKSIDELLFGGFKVEAVGDLLDLARSFLGEDEVPDVLPNNTFGLYYGKNNTYSENFTIATGRDDIKDYSNIVSWNNYKNLPFWNDEYCNKINGSDGLQFPPFLKKTETLYVFIKEICRSLYFEYEKDFFIRKLPVYRFIIPDRLYSAATINEDNKCFCSVLKSCDVGGITPVGPCYMDVPIVASAPHFYQGDSSLLKEVRGLRPNKDQHESFFDIDPVTGTVVKGVRKLQINADVRKSENLELLASISDMVLPVFWISQEYELSNEDIDYLYWKIVFPLSIAPVVSLSALILGCTSFFLSIISWCFLKNVSYFQSIRMKIAKRSLIKRNSQTGNELKKF
ncbi:lysosome membrane protein 2-like isoform X1 [Centruroides sculpturatus]|uniref:lysosome membrane protein 2-like isoform X1 n=1 Tax=Centruroides sculpturatus TaxID=218467 RepID=UPI000C6DD6ED|nr:lysosome membrane protein 2-like isoform X1 [Centruroides sculpturatus]